MSCTFTYEHTDIVHAPIDLLWKLLLDKVSSPSRYVPGVHDVKILSHTDNMIEREMCGGPYDEMIHEIITWNDNTYTITFTLADDHPHFYGTIVNIITPNAEGGCGAPSLTYRMKWKRKHAHDPRACLLVKCAPASIKGAVIHIKHIAERVASRLCKDREYTPDQDMDGNSKTVTLQDENENEMVKEMDRMMDKEMEKEKEKEANQPRMITRNKKKLV